MPTSRDIYLCVRWVCGLSSCLNTRSCTCSMFSLVLAERGCFIEMTGTVTKYFNLYGAKL